MGTVLVGAASEDHVDIQGWYRPGLALTGCLGSGKLAPPLTCMQQHSVGRPRTLPRSGGAGYGGRDVVSQSPGSECGRAALPLICCVVSQASLSSPSFGNQKSCPQGHERWRVCPAPHHLQHSGERALGHENVRSDPAPHQLKH